MHGFLAGYPKFSADKDGVPSDLQGAAEEFAYNIDTRIL